jgi:hypothetical protein
MSGSYPAALPPVNHTATVPRGEDDAASRTIITCATVTTAGIPGVSGLGRRRPATRGDEALAILFDPTTSPFQVNPKFTHIEISTR